MRDFDSGRMAEFHTGHMSTDLMELPYRLCDEHKPPEVTSEDFDDEIAYVFKKIRLTEAGLGIRTLTGGVTDECIRIATARERQYLARLIVAKAKSRPRVTRYEHPEPLEES